MPETGCIVIAPDVPFTIAALIGCAVTTGFGAVVNDAAVRPGDAVAVIGVGGVGVNALAAAALAGAQTVIAIDRNRAKQAVAMASGATHFIDAGAPDAVNAVRALTSGRGVDHAIESTGHPSAMTAAYDITRPAGSVVIIGIAPVGAQLSIPAIGFPGSKKRIIGSIYGGGVPEQDIHRIIALYRSGRLPLEQQIGECIPLERINEAFTWLEQSVAARTMILPS